MVVKWSTPMAQREPARTEHPGSWSSAAPEGYLGFILVSAGQAIGRDFDRRLGEIGLRQTEFSTLFFLAHAPGIAQAELARRVYVSPQAMAKVLPDLERRGLVERAAAGPGLAIETKLTEAGIAALERARPIVEAANSPAGLGLTDLECGELLRMLRRIETQTSAPTTTQTSEHAGEPATAEA
jgi:DNA-binding MarR family transcriptional regulator